MELQPWPWFELFAWVENLGPSVWIREALWAFPTLLALHALGMAFLVGTSLIINLRLLGLVPALPLAPLSKFFPLMIFAFAVNLLSGVLLLLAYPAKGLTNPLFYLKLALVIAAVTITFRQKPLLAQTQPPDACAKRLALLTLVLWLAGIVSGRFLAYTHSWLLVS